VEYAAISWDYGQFDEALVDISSLGYHGVEMFVWTWKDGMLSGL
jgi:hypothetical protein